MFACPLYRVGSFGQRMLRCLVGAALVSVVALVGQGAAQASSCGHYVKRLGPGFVPGKTAANADQAASRDQQPESPRGCKGAECHRAPQPFLPTTPGKPVRMQNVQEHAVISLVSEGDPLDQAWQVEASTVHLSRGHWLRLDRPPRG